jgi:hypothetical protein
MSTTKTTIKIVQVCASCGDELDKYGFRYIHNTRYCGWCARNLSFLTR